MRASLEAHAEVAEVYKRHYDALRARAQDYGHNVLSLWEDETYKLEQAQADLRLLRGFSELVLPHAVLGERRGERQYTATDDIYTAKIIASRALFGSTSSFRSSDGIYYPVGSRKLSKNETQLLTLHPVGVSRDLEIEDVYASPYLLNVETKGYDAWREYSAHMTARDFTPEEVLAMRPAGQRMYLLPRTEQGIGIGLSASKSDFGKLSIDKIIKKGLSSVDGRVLTVNSHVLSADRLLEFDIASYGIEEPMADLAAAFGKTDELQGLLKERIEAFGKNQ
jgi:hypothetical protein